jgi:hypothetical protein
VAARARLTGALAFAWLADTFFVFLRWSRVRESRLRESRARE